MLQDAVDNQFEIDIIHAIPLKDLRMLLERRPTTRTLIRWHIDGLINFRTREKIHFPALRSPHNSREYISTIAAYEWFVRQLNRTE